MRFSARLALLASLAATSLGAHPHIFVDTGFELVVDDSGQLAHVRVIWQYDDFYSLLVTEDMKLDQDGDGTMTDTEIDRLTGFDMQWVEGFDGDLELLRDDKPLELSAPQEVTASFSDGRITTTHLRALAAPVPAGETVTLMAYDPTYYTAYEVTRPVTVAGEKACEIRLKAPEMTNGLAQMQQQLAALDAQSNPEDAGLPNIGADMASRVTVTCAAS